MGLLRRRKRVRSQELRRWLRLPRACCFFGLLLLVQVTYLLYSASTTGQKSHDIVLASDCPPGLFPIASQRRLCDPCPQGFCAELQGRLVWGSKENRQMQQDIALHKYGSAFRVFHPVLVNAQDVAFRVSNLTKCDEQTASGVSWIRPAVSYLEVCKRLLQNTSCQTFELNPSTFPFRRADGLEYLHDQIFIGPEDVHVYPGNKLVVFFTLNVRIVHNATVHAPQVSRVARGVLRSGQIMDVTILERQERSLVNMDIDDKNWTPFVWRGKTFVLAQGHPLQVLHVDTYSGLCTLFGSDEWSTPFGFAAASSAPVALGNDTFMTLLHYHRYYGFGRIYTHLFLVFSMQKDGAVIRSLSQPFRFPSPDAMYNAQIGSGLLNYGGSLAVSYGEGDCASYIMLPSIATESLLTHSRPSVPSVNTRTIAERKTHLRLVGPLCSTSAFAIFNRGLSSGIILQWNKTMLFDILDTTAPYDRATHLLEQRGGILKEALVLSNQQHNRNFDVLLHSKWPIEWTYVSGLIKSCKVLLVLPWDLPFFPPVWLSYMQMYVTQTFVLEKSMQERLEQKQLEARKLPPSIMHLNTERKALLTSNRTVVIHEVTGTQCITGGCDIAFEAFRRAVNPREMVQLKMFLRFPHTCDNFGDLKHKIHLLVSAGYDVICEGATTHLERQLEAADILLHPARIDTFQMVPLLAMKLGLAVIAPLSGVLYEYVGEQGLYPVPTVLVTCTFQPCGNNSYEEYATNERPKVWEPQRDATASVLQHALQNQAERNRIGARAAHRLRKLTAARSATALVHQVRKVLPRRSIE